MQGPGVTRMTPGLFAFGAGREERSHDEVIISSHRWGGQPPWRKVRTLLLNEAEKGRKAEYRHDLGGCKPNRP